MRGEIKRNMPLAKKLLPSMRAAGLAIINEIATTDSVAQHIKEITALGYNSEIHKRFSDFVIEHVDVFDSSWQEMKAVHANVRASSRLIRPVGEILVDYMVLEACRKLTTRDGPRMNCTEDQFISALPFVPPPFNLVDAFPYTPVAHTFWKLGYLTGEVEILADSGEYDDIFEKFFLWRTYYKEPFHARRLGYFRTMSGYYAQRKVDKIKEEESKIKEEAHAKVRARKYQMGQWQDNARSARQDKDKRQEEINDLKKMPLSERLTSIANSNYSIDYYHPEYNREKWAEEFGRESVVNSLDEKSKDRLALKLYDKCYIGWDSVRGQLARDGFPKNIC